MPCFTTTVLRGLLAAVAGRNRTQSRLREGGGGSASLAESGGLFCLPLAWLADSGLQGAVCMPVGGLYPPGVTRSPVETGIGCCVSSQHVLTKRLGGTASDTLTQCASQGACSSSAGRQGGPLGLTAKHPSTQPSRSQRDAPPTHLGAQHSHTGTGSSSAARSARKHKVHVEEAKSAEEAASARSSSEMKQSHPKQQRLGVCSRRETHQSEIQRRRAQGHRGNGFARHQWYTPC